MTTRKRAITLSVTGATIVFSPRGQRLNTFKHGLPLLGLLLMLTIESVSAANQRQWQDGVWGDPTRASAGALAVPFMGGAVAVPIVETTYIVETPRYRYFGSWRKTKPVPMTVNAPVQFAIEKDKLYVIGEDSKEYELKLTKKVLKPESANLSSPQPPQTVDAPASPKAEQTGASQRQAVDTAQVDGLTVDDLVKKLGLPSLMQNDADGVTVLYYDTGRGTRKIYLLDGRAYSVRPR